MSTKPDDQPTGQAHSHGEKVHGDKLEHAVEQSAGVQGAKAQDAKGKMQGEGDYDAARRYRKDVEDYVDEQGETGVQRKAVEAQKAVDGPEGDALRKAEDEGKSHARS